MKGKIARSSTRSLARARRNCTRRTGSPAVKASECFRRGEPITIRSVRCAIKKGYRQIVEFSGKRVVAVVSICGHVTKLAARPADSEGEFRAFQVPTKYFKTELAYTARNTLLPFAWALSFCKKQGGVTRSIALGGLLNFLGRKIF